MTPSELPLNLFSFFYFLLQEGFAFVLPCRDPSNGVTEIPPEVLKELSEMCIPILHYPEALVVVSLQLTLHLWPLYFVPLVCSYHIPHIQVEALLKCIPLTSVLRSVFQMNLRMTTAG